MGIGAAEEMRIASERECDWEEGFAFNARTVRFRCSSLWLSLRVCVFFVIVFLLLSVTFYKALSLYD